MMNQSGWMGGGSGGELWVSTVIGALVVIHLVVLIAKQSNR